MAKNRKTQSGAVWIVPVFKAGLLCLLLPFKFFLVLAFYLLLSTAYSFHLKARLLNSAHLRRGAVVEPYRPDLFDLNVSVRSWPDVQLSAIERPIPGAVWPKFE